MFLNLVYIKLDLVKRCYELKSFSFIYIYVYVYVCIYMHTYKIYIYDMLFGIFIAHKLYFDHKHLHLSFTICPDAEWWCIC